MTSELAIKILNRMIKTGIAYDDGYGVEPLTKDEETACLMGKEALEQKTEWIPVSERLPEDGTWNIFTDGKNISVERYKADALDHFYPSGRWFPLEDAIAWMPLPEPYKEG